MNGFILLFLIVASPILLASTACVGAQENVSVVSTTIYQTYGSHPFSVSKGDYLVAGEIQNYGSEPQKFNITATFYDYEGYIIGTSYLSDSNPDASPCYMHVLLPNAKSPFEIWFSRFDEEGNFRLVDHYDLTINTSPADNYYPGLEITSHSSHETDGTLFVEGNVKNTGTKTMNYFNVFVTFYNENGDVLAVAMETGYSTSPISESLGLAPGDSASFSVGLNGFNEGGRLEAISNYEVTAEGYEPSLWTADGKLINPEVIYVLGTPKETVAPIASQDQPYLVYVLAIVAAAAILIAVTYTALRKRAKKNNPIKPKSN